MNKNKNNTQEQLNNNIDQKDAEEIRIKEELENLKNLLSKPNIFIPVKDKLSEFNKLDRPDEKLTKDEKKRRTELSTDLAMIYGIKNGIWLVHISHQKYQGALAQIKLDIINDYQCKTAIELMIADRIAANYWKAMRYDLLICHFIEKEDGGYTFNDQKVGIMKELHKGIELCNRQLNSDIILLKELKQPQINLKIKTENTFIAQNQQVNNQKEINDSK